MSNLVGLATLRIEVKVVLVNDVEQCVFTERGGIVHHFTLVIKAFDKLSTHVAHTVANVVVAALVLRYQVHTLFLVRHHLIHCVNCNLLPYYAFALFVRANLCVICLDCAFLSHVIYPELEDFGALSIHTNDLNLPAGKDLGLQLKIRLKANHDEEGGDFYAEEHGVHGKREDYERIAVTHVHVH
jgi:hypothetical protein